MTGELTSTAVVTPRIDWAEINARWEAQRAEARAQLQAERAELLAGLRALGVEGIEGHYDGYGDSGNVGEITVLPKGVELGDLAARVEDFVWAVAYDKHPGFENNDGGEGTVSWTIAEDRIDLEHANFYTSRDDYSYEGI